MVTEISNYQEGVPRPFEPLVSSRYSYESGLLVVNRIPTPNSTESLGRNVSVSVIAGLVRTSRLSSFTRLVWFHVGG